MRFGEVFRGLNVAAKSMKQNFDICTKRVHSSLSNYVQNLNENGRKFERNFGNKRVLTTRKRRYQNSQVAFVKPKSVTILSYTHEFVWRRNICWRQKFLWRQNICWRQKLVWRSKVVWRQILVWRQECFAATLCGAKSLLVPKVL